MTVKRHFTYCEPFEIHHCEKNITMVVVWRELALQHWSRSTKWNYVGPG